MQAFVFTGIPTVSVAPLANFASPMGQTGSFCLPMAQDSAFVSLEQGGTVEMQRRRRRRRR